MHADAAKCAWVVFHPTGVKAIVGLKLTPVWHGCAFEAPTRWLGTQVAGADFVVTICKAMTVGTVHVIFFENTKVAFGGRC